MRRAVANHKVKKLAKEPTTVDSVDSPPAAGRNFDESRKPQRCHVVGLSVLISTCCLLGCWRMNVVVVKGMQSSVPNPDPVLTLANAPTTTTTTTTTWSHCTSLSIFPPHLNKEKSKEICGKLFYPLEFSEREVPSSYIWKHTGYAYYAAGIGLHHVTFDVLSPSSSLSLPSQSFRHNIIYNSMMKCGSTSVNRALKELKQAAKENFPDTPMTVIYQGNQNNLLAKESHRVMNELYEYQHQQQQKIQGERIAAPQNFANGTFLYFTTVRDPVSRFVSAIAQEMYVRRNDPKAQSFRDKCLLETPQKTIDCSIRHVQDRFQGLEELVQPHFIPMTTILYRRSYGFNVSVVLLPTDQVSRIVSQMVAPSRLTTFETIKNPLKAQGSQVLKNMTVADLTPRMMDNICDLYAMDVRMMKQAGFPTLCL